MSIYRSNAGQHVSHRTCSAISIIAPFNSRRLGNMSRASPDRTFKTDRLLSTIRLPCVIHPRQLHGRHGLVNPHFPRARRPSGPAEARLFPVRELQTPGTVCHIWWTYPRATILSSPQYGVHADRLSAGFRRPCRVPWTIPPLPGRCPNPDKIP